MVLNVKRLHELAGQRYLIDAFGQLARSRRDIRLIICGTGALHEELERQARMERISDRTTFAGLVSNAEVAKYAAVADVFALPSLLEAMPTVAVEALAAGTPVVSADHPGGVELHGIFDDDVTLVPMRNAEALAGALSMIIDAPRRTRPETAASIAHLFRPSAVLANFDRIYALALGGAQ